MSANGQTRTTTAIDKAKNQIAKRNAQTVKDLLERALPQIRAALPRHMTPERMIRIGYSAISRNTELLKCEPLSLVKAVIEASELGLEPAGILGHAYLVPYNNEKTGKKEAQLQIGSRGYVELAYRSGRVRSICAEVVYQGDKFEVLRGTEEYLRHEPSMDRDEDAQPLCAYAVVRYNDGGVDFELLSLKKIAEAKKASLTGRKDKGPWATHWEEMARKTAIRRLAKRLPLSPELTTAAARDEMRERASCVGAPMGLETMDVDYQELPQDDPDGPDGVAGTQGGEQENQN